jgi:predicted O-linked N-acetylglucosamine transferase (SPINDLY family)
MSSRIADLNAVLNEALALHQAGRLSEAEQLYRNILKQHPSQADSLHLLGVVHLQRGDHREALRQFDLALKIAPKAAAVHANRGAALLHLRRLEDALASCDRAISFKADCVEAFNTRAAVLISLRRYKEALASSEKAITLKPNYVQALNNRGYALKELNRWTEALASYDHAIALQPDFADAHNNRANVLNRLDRFEDSVASAQRAIALKPDLAEAHLNLGTACVALKRHDEAVKSYGRALMLNPELEHLRGSYLHAKLYACDWSNLQENRTELEAALARGRPASAPFQLLACAPDPELQRKCTESFAARHVAAGKPLWRGETYRHERIRLAYLSGDFGDHPVSLLTVRSFEQHDRSRFETTAISFGPDSSSPIRVRVKSAFDRFIDAQTKTADEVATLLRDLEIDVAVDLSGFTDGGRPAVFAQRPAPVQVNYLGYAGTLGSKCWDYIIADPFVIPLGAETYYTEKVVRLPHCYMPNDDTRQISARTPSRLEAGLPESGLVFCCFNNSYKFTPEGFDVWMRLLARVEGSVLWLSSAGAGAMDNLRREAKARGVAPERLVFAPRLPLNEDHLARLKLADIFLDTPGYNAHTTAADALWVGVPVVSCAGRTFAGRVAGSLLHAAGLPELAVESLAEYEALAMALARDPGRLASLRQKLAQNRNNCPLFDSARYTRHLETAYSNMYERAARGERPESFDIGWQGQAPNLSRSAAG